MLMRKPRQWVHYSRPSWRVGAPDGAETIPVRARIFVIGVFINDDNN